jgi:hypothetical protein
MTSAKVGLPCHVGWSGSVFRVSGSTKSYNMAFKVMLIALEECVSEAMVDILGRYGRPEVWKCCSLAAAHTHTQIATRTLLRSTNLRVNNDFYLHYES